jgi:hypothetical protein
MVNLERTLYGSVDEVTINVPDPAPTAPQMRGADQIVCNATAVNILGNA